MPAAHAPFDARIIGPGRAGGALARALTAAGWRVDGPLGRDHDPARATSGARLVLLAVPDVEVAVVATSLAPGEAVVAHVAGALGLDVLSPHDRVASVHPLVALLGQVDRLARRIGVPLEAYLDLARGALDDVAEVGPVDALTGPVARGDRDTVARHLAALPEDERTLYAVLAEAAERLVAQREAVRT